MSEREREREREVVLKPKCTNLSTPVLIYYIHTYIALHLTNTEI